MKSLLFLVTTLLLSACGIEAKQTQGVEGKAEIVARIEIAFPDCAGIEDDALRVECIRIAAEAAKSIFGALTGDQQAILDELGIDIGEDDGTGDG